MMFGAIVISIEVYGLCTASSVSSSLSALVKRTADIFSEHTGVQ